MNVFSNSNWTLSSMPLSIGSLTACRREPPRSSSQLADHETFIGLPVMSEKGRATGKFFWAGALSTVS
ncbi:MAG: hypothetical protein BWY91_01275 [bacterium ADurb.BinA028]|nr:MAG: hypothetical protein BWY91_01275 [bacterium ADurb.BinA028]